MVNSMPQPITLPLVVVRKAAPEHKLRIAFPPLSDNSLGKHLIWSSPDAIATTPVIEHDRGLAQPHNILLILMSLISMRETPLKSLLSHRLYQPRLPRWLRLVVAGCFENSLYGSGRNVVAVDTKVASYISASLFSTVSIAAYFL